MMELDINFWVWMFLIVFMVHNFEEILTIEKWLKQTYPKIKNDLPSFIVQELDSKREMSAGQFSMAVCLLFVIVSMITIVVTSTNQFYYLFLGANIFFALNIFTHPLQSLYLKKYVPGTYSSILLVLPYTIFVFYQFYSEDLLTSSNIVLSIVIAILFIPTLLLSHKIADKWKVYNSKSN